MNLFNIVNVDKCQCSVPSMQAHTGNDWMTTLSVKLLAAQIYGSNQIMIIIKPVRRVISFRFKRRERVNAHQAFLMTTSNFFCHLKTHSDQ